MRISLLRIAVLCGLSMTATLRGDEGPRPPSGTVRLGGGRVVDYTIHFDRNSLRDSVRLDDGLIALTTSGALLRFELPAVRLVRERIDIEEVTCLGRGEGGAVLAGLGDGRVCRVDPATLELADVVKLPAAPRWIGWGRAQANGNRPAGLVVVTRPTRPFDRDGRHWDVPYSVVNDLASKKTFALEDEASAFLLDRAGRVWLGADRGEWGGRVTRVDLVKGTVAAIPPPPSRDPDEKAFWEGVYGFIERPDGQVWAFGGTSHMGLNSGEITRIDGDGPQRLFAFEPPDDPEQKPDPDRPRMPITHIVADDGGLRVFSYSDVFRVDGALKSWKQVATLDIAYRWGRPNAVGAYPSVVAVHPPMHAGGPYLLATVGDGYVRLEGAKATANGLPGQLGASGVDRVENTSEGPLFFEGDDRLPVWRLGASGWEIAEIDPPYEPDPASDVFASEKDDGSWYETRVLVGPGGAIYTVSATSWSDGTRTTARRVDGKSVRIGRETSDLNASDSFLTADGTLWNASYGKLKRFEKGRWEAVAQWPREGGPIGLRALHTAGPPWLLLDRFPNEYLWRLEPGARGDGPRLTREAIREGGKPLRIDDAIPWTDGALLLATDAGLRAYAPDTRKLARVDIPEPESPASALARDGLGRLWLGGGHRGRLWLGGGHGLWLAEPGARAVESLDRVPWVGRSEVDALSPDPQHADGVIAALGARGAAFVRAGPKP